jgi:radical SAM-linked protein
VRKKFRLYFSKTGAARYIGHLELTRIFIRAFKRSGISLAYSKGFHPMPKVSFAKALAVGIESLDETVDIEVEGAMRAEDLGAAMAIQLPGGLRIERVEALAAGSKKPKLRETHYRIRLNGVDLDSERVKTFLACDDFPVTLDRGTGRPKRVVNLRSRLRSLAFQASHEIRMVLRHTDGPELKPPEILAHIFSLDPSRLKAVEILKTRQILD